MTGRRSEPTELRPRDASRIATATLPGGERRRSGKLGAGLIFACIDIGSNTTRLLVADAGDGGLRALAAERVFTRIGGSLSGDGSITAEKISETAEVVRTQAIRARAAGAAELVVVATAAIRDAPNRDELVAAVERSCGLEVHVLSGEEEARLCFVGATRTLPAAPDGPVAVIDVGGGSTEVAVGHPQGSVFWSESRRIGSGSLADVYLRSDPPGAPELAAVRRHVADVFEGLEPPAVESALAVGGTATSLRRLVGAELSHETLERATGALARSRVGELAERLDLDPERVRLLPAGILVLEALSDRLRVPLRIARGGLREGVILELSDRSYG